jgi:hypothetical protein
MHLLPRLGKEGGVGVKLLYRGMWKWILEKLLHCLFCILLSDRHRYDSTVYLVGELECMDKKHTRNERHAATRQKKVLQPGTTCN